MSFASLQVWPERREGDNGTASGIAAGKVRVPAALWKIIVTLPVGSSDDVNRINIQTQVITA